MRSWWRWRRRSRRTEDDGVKLEPFNLAQVRQQPLGNRLIRPRSKTPAVILGLLQQGASLQQAMLLVLQPTVVLKGIVVPPGWFFPCMPPTW